MQKALQTIAVRSKALHAGTNTSVYFSSYESTNIINTSLIIVSETETEIFPFILMRNSVATNQRRADLHPRLYKWLDYEEIPPRPATASGSDAV